MKASLIRRIGFWCGIFLVILGFVYLGLIVTIILSGSGFPPAGHFQTIANALVLLTAVWTVFFWTILHQAVTAEKKLFTRASLALIIIFAALTSINRYVGLTVVRQSIAAGNLNGLQWFLPYTWPSVMLALEFLAWGFFFGLACLCLAPVFTKGKLEHSIFWTLIIIGVLCLLSIVGQLTGSSNLNFDPFTMIGTIAWGPGFTILAILLVIWFRKSNYGSN